MTNIISYKDELIIGFNKKIYFIDVHNSVIKKALEIPPNLQKADIDASSKVDTSSDQKIELLLPTTAIQYVDISPNGDYLAITLTGQKCLLLYKICDRSVQLLSIRNLSRASSALSFSSDSTKLLICDKTGDCYLFDCIDYNKSGKWILGHLSVVMDVTFSPDQQFIITCDRDEKIKVTRYPESHEIECYCLGHIEYVSSIKLLPFDPNTYLLSLSGDKTIKIWKYKIGLKVYEFEIPAPGVKFSLQKINDFVCHVAVLLYQPKENVLVFEIKLVNGIFESTLLRKHCFNPAIVSNLCYGGSNLYLTLVQDNRLNIEIINEKSEDCTSHKNLKEIANKLCKDEQYTELENISLWFKKKFDNVSEYLERKKRRIEEKSLR